ncbi:MAG: hypothetical protein U1D41_05380 [Nitrosomonas sp.]|uniref:hypothetical protein n=1 Tax=Nitrosomonas sp. TaxID=42353 RepID=UPI002735EDB9|nr:hypothetical protein [Nitrosomonas sp.]MDP3280582.1 hypothetical protein [Nitrosomonas sp.]MDZ4105588.1 hypothetical protein [Nitrosomonas sp.]
MHQGRFVWGRSDTGGMELTSSQWEWLIAAASTQCHLRRNAAKQTVPDANAAGTATRRYHPTATL